MASELAYFALGTIIVLMSVAAGNLWGLLAGFALIFGRSLYCYWRFLNG
ncbi:MAG: hypothetical protein ACKN9W_13685 [Methylococcus sp.]